jgi:acyl-CoA dehydrogenase
MIARRLFSEEHEIFRDSVRRFVEREIVPHHGAWEEQGFVPRDVWRKAGAEGLLCCTIPEEYGGPGGSFLHSVIVIEELARVGATGPAFPLHSDMVAPYILHYGTEEQKKHWLPLMARGEVLASIAMTEPSGGSDLQAMRTSAIRDGDVYRVNGQKVFITNAENADLIVLACKTDPKARAKGISLLLVETTREGFRRGRRLQKIGCKASDTLELFFDDVRVPLSNLLGSEEGQGFRQLMSTLSQERLVQAVRAVAAAEAALSWTIEYTTERKAFGHTIADFQNTQFTLAELHAQIVTQRVFVDRCIELHLEQGLDSTDAAIAKMTTTLQGRVMDQCLQLFGGWGYMWEYPIARAFVDARMGRIAGGSIEIMKHIIARNLLKSAERSQ